jgi:hypothetical protein
MLADPVRRRVLRQSASGTIDAPAQVARDLAMRIRELGGEAMLRNIETRARAGHAG